MSKYDECLKDLHQIITNLKSKLDERGQKVCERELTHLQHAIDLPATESSMMNKLNEIVKKIDDMGKALEKEMHGIQNYSDYERERLEDYSYKEEIKKAAEKMLAKLSVK